MSGDLFKVQFIRSKTSFLFIPDKWAKKLTELRKLENDSTIKVVYDTNKTAYFGWQQTSTQPSDVVGINATVATNLGLKEGDPISLVICGISPNVHRVEMSPLSHDDLEMIESSSGLLQSILLNQIRVVWQNQLLTAWISSSLPIVLHVDSMDPDVNVGRLQQMTEVVVGDPLQNNGLPVNGRDCDSRSVISEIASSGMNIASSILNAMKTETHTENLESSENMLSTERMQYIFRVHPLCSDQPHHGPLDAFIPRATMLKIFHFSTFHKESIFCKITKLPSSTDSKGTSVSLSEEDIEETSLNEDLSLYIHLMNVETIEDANEKYYCSDTRCIYVSNNVRNSLQLEVGSRVILSDFSGKPPLANFERVELFPFYGLKCFDLDKSLIRHIDNLPGGLLLSKNMLLTIPSERGYIDVDVRLVPSSLSHTLVLPGQLDSRKIQIRLEKRPQKQLKLPGTKSFIPKNIADDLYLNHLQSLLIEGLMSLKLTLSLQEISFDKQMPVCINNNILILGKNGCGKTSAAGAICNLIQGPPHYVHNAIIKCRPLKGKTVESLFKHFQSFIDDCVYHQPSVLIIDDLECIAGVPEDQDQNSQVSSYFKRVGTMLLHLFGSLQSSHSVAIIATAPSLSSLSPALVPPRGIHLLNIWLELPELSKGDRQGVLEKLLSRKLANKEVRELRCSESIEDLSKRTEGYCSQDLADLVDKAILASCMRQVLSCKVPVLESADLLQALSDSTPMLLRGVSLHKDSALVWEDIGGLVDVKSELKEVFEWPVMYPELFQNSPLRQQSGLLLYGAPGTGKTMLAAAVASECGLNFISVKGPELLSKYIGASEEAVRNVFFKAQSAKPCVLFFDEFDSLAPRRGHDNTGVTDRVVNQLLTQLDGVESLVGVWVLAATSRPDLLDPALLRPGRLDRSVLCPLPNEEDRLAILKALSRKMALDRAVNFSEIAAQTDGFTGADLQSLLYTAQLSAIEDQQSYIHESVQPHTGKQALLTVTQSHLDTATKNTRPSLSVQERNKYLHIYRKFGVGRKDNAANILEGLQRATLA